MLLDHHRGYGGLVLEHHGRKVGAYRPETIRNVHMGPGEAIKVFHDLRSHWFVPIHYGTFRLSFEDIDERPRWLQQLARVNDITHRIRILEEGSPEVF